MTKAHKISVMKMKSRDNLQEIGIDTLMLLKTFLNEFVLGFVLGSCGS